MCTAVDADTVCRAVHADTVCRAVHADAVFTTVHSDAVCRAVHLDAVHADAAPVFRIAVQGLCCNLFKSEAGMLVS